MLESISVMGIVAGSYPINEYDRRVILITKERGKITAFARGARRQYSPMLASTQIFAFGQFKVIEGKNAYTLVSAEITNYFEDIPKDPVSACYASYFLELSRYYAHENTNEVEMLKLIYQTLRVLCKKSVPSPLIKVIFELKTLVINGEYPETFQCVLCGNKEKLYHFSSEKNGIVCDGCLTEAGQVIYLESSTLYTLQYIISSTIEKLYTFNVSEHVLHQLQMIMDVYIKRNIDYSFKSLEILDLMIKIT